jgi:sulfite reductase alpha subunit-like flavoprotein
MDSDAKWKKVAVVVGSAAVIGSVMIYKKASRGAPKKGKSAIAASADGHVLAPLVKDPEEIPKYMKATTEKQAIVSPESMTKIGDLSKFMAFKGEYKTRFAARPDVAEGELVRVTDWKRLTPLDYDRTCFHFEVDITGTSMEHTVNGSQGKALSVYSTNDPAMVAKFLDAMGLDRHEIVSVEELAPPEEENTAVLTSLEKLYALPGSVRQANARILEKTLPVRN